MPAPPTIIECPHCNDKALKAGILSGNTFGAVSWSDGKMVAPMLPDFPTLDEYIELLHSDQLGDGANEKYVRTYVWWTLNDLVRGDEKKLVSFNKYHDLFHDNLDKLKKLLDPVIPEDRC